MLGLDDLARLPSSRGLPEHTTQTPERAGRVMRLKGEQSFKAFAIRKFFFYLNVRIGVITQFDRAEGHAGGV